MSEEITGLTKKEIEGLEVNSSLKILRRTIKYFMKLCPLIELKYEDLLDTFGLGEQKYDARIMKLLPDWAGYSLAEKKEIRNWVAMNAEERREWIKSDRGITDEAEIDRYFSNFGAVLLPYDGMNFKKLDEAVAEKEERAKRINPPKVIFKIGKLYFDEYNEETDQPGELFLELTRILAKAINKPEITSERLIETDYKNLLELLIRVALKPQEDANSSFFIERAVNLFVKSIGLSDIMKKGI